ncbi:MAG: glycyl-radical enzyme activating protein [Desulfatibacillaceae bacterium]
MIQDDQTKGLVLNIQRMSTEDGPGIRTTVFMKGCPLACRWCHNPESISRIPQVQWLATKCIGCRTCEAVCPEHAVSLGEAGMVIDREKCTVCGVCTSECPPMALEMLGEAWTVADLVAEVAKDRAYFEQSGGGITASGGEPALQPRFTRAFLSGCRDIGLSTALDTCGVCSGRVLDGLLPHADMVLFDVKCIDEATHKRFTGAGNAGILDNLLRTAQHVREHEKTLWIRTPLIPGATADIRVIGEIGAWLAEHVGDAVERWELCAFNNLCRDKYERLGMTWDYASEPLMERAELDVLRNAARACGLEGERVMWTGSARLED